MESKSVTLMLRFKDADGKWNRRPVARGANGRVKPGHALIDGKPVVEPAARRTLRVLVTVVLSFLLLSCGHLAAGQVSRDELNAELIQAAKDGNTAAAQQVLPFGASADAKDENGVTALMWAVGNGNIGVMKLLLNKGANIGAKDKDGHTALDRAKANGRTEAAKLLRKAASVQEKPGTGQ